MVLAFFKPKDNCAYATKISEKRLSNLQFNVFKFNARVRPTKTDRVLIISCFSEFGCEVLGPMYCIPRLLKRYPGRYVIVMGWYGREYLYKHLVDEFWELKEEHMWLRDHARAFHHISDNLKKCEEAATKYGVVVPSAALGKYFVGNYCKTCGKFWSDWQHASQACPACGSQVIVPSVLGSPEEYKKTARMIPRPSRELMAWASKFLQPNSVGVFARNRKTYGRNLDPEFYKSLICLLEEMGYNPIWLGEKQNVLPCPVDHILDFSQMREARDLDRTLAIVTHLKFTVQFWTASTRLAGIMGTPYILFESPEQIYCTGLRPAQEGKRLLLTTFGPKKLVIAHYVNVVNNPTAGLGLLRRAISELELGNEDDIIGLVEDHETVKKMQSIYQDMLRSKT